MIGSRLRRTTVAGVFAVLTLAACSPGDGGANDGGNDGNSNAATPSASRSPTSPTPLSTKSSPGSGGSDTQLPPAPPNGACYDLEYTQVTEPTNDAAPVPCSEPHTTQTIHVGRLETVVEGHSVAVDSRAAQRQLARECPRQLARHVGGSPKVRALSRLAVVWFGPTVEQSDLGATWFRCDVLALAEKETLAPLPSSGRLRGLLDRPRALDRYGLCGTSDPGSPGFSRVICSVPHTWRALATIPLPGGTAYPGPGAVRRSGEDTCSDLVRRRTANATRFRYGWEWPSRAQWAAGQHYGFCWAPGNGA